MTVDVLGTEYTISKSDVAKDEDLKGLGGYTDFENKDIVINSILDECKVTKDVTKRHEIIHAFLYESGLDSSSWGRNEEIVDWFAIQFPKLLKVFKQSNCIEI